MYEVVTPRPRRKILPALFLGVPWLAVVGLLAAAEYARTDGWLTRSLLEAWTSSSGHTQVALATNRDDMSLFAPKPQPTPSVGTLAQTSPADPIVHAFAVEPDLAARRALEMFDLPALEDRLRSIEMEAVRREAEAPRHDENCEKVTRSLAASRAAVAELQERRASNLVVRVGKRDCDEPATWHIDAAPSMNIYSRNGE